MNMESLWKDPAFGVSITIVTYALMRLIQRKRSWFHPAMFTGIFLMLLLGITGIPYEDYKVGGDMIVYILGPATVALGVPLYKHYQRIRDFIVPILSGITAGAISAIVSGAALVWAAGGTREILIPMLPKSVTSPVSIELVRSLGGIPELGAAFTVIAGILGSLIGPEFLRLCGVRSDIAVGAAIGTSSHGIGTSRLTAESELAGSLGGFAMALNAIITSILLTPLLFLMGH